MQFLFHLSFLMWMYLVSFFRKLTVWNIHSLKTARSQSQPRGVKVVQSLENKSKNTHKIIPKGVVTYIVKIKNVDGHYKSTESISAMEITSRLNQSLLVLCSAFLS